LKLLWSNVYDGIGLKFTGPLELCPLHVGGPTFCTSLSGRQEELVAGVAYHSH